MIPGYDFDRCWLLTSTTYGTWLPGAERGFVSNVRGDDNRGMRHNRPGEEYDRALPTLQRFAKQKLRGSPIVFTQKHAELLEAQFQETAEHRGWSLLAVALMATHVHLVTGVMGDPDPDVLLRDYKSYGSRVLNRAFGAPASGTWWTESGSRRKLPTSDAVVGAVRYVMQQERPLRIWTHTGERGA